MKSKVVAGTTEYNVVVQARSSQEAMEQALLILRLTLQNVERMEAVES